MPLCILQVTLHLPNGDGNKRRMSPLEYSERQPSAIAESAIKSHQISDAIRKCSFSILDGRECVIIHDLKIV